MLFQKLKNTPEGDLSRIRANLVKQDTLHHIALRLEVAKVLRLVPNALFDKLLAGRPRKRWQTVPA